MHLSSSWLSAEMCQAGGKLHRSAKFEIPKVLCSALVNEEVKGDSYMEYNF